MEYNLTEKEKESIISNRLKDSEKFDLDSRLYKLNFLLDADDSTLTIKDKDNNRVVLVAKIENIDLDELTNVLMARRELKNELEKIIRKKLSKPF